MKYIWKVFSCNSLLSLSILTMLTTTLLSTLLSCTDGLIEEPKISEGTAITPQKSIVITSMTLSSKTSGVGETKISVSYSPEDASSKVVTWTSSDKETATVSPAGKVIALKSGSVTITATATDGSGVEASTQLTFSLNLSLKPGKSTTLSAGTTIKLDDVLSYTYLPAYTPSDPEENLVVWETHESKDGIVTIDNKKGELTTVSAGTVNIRVTSHLSSNTVEFNVVSEVIGLLLLRKEGKNDFESFVANEEDLAKVFDVVVIKSDENLDDKDVVWSIDPPMKNIATITDGGVLTPISAGTIMIKVASASNLGRSSLPVSYVIRDKIKLLLSRKNEAKDRSAVVGGQNVDLLELFDVKIESVDNNNYEFKWSIASEEKDIATVTDVGLLTPKKLGSLMLKITLLTNENISSNEISLSVHSPVTEILLARKIGESDTKAKLTDAPINLLDIFDVTITPAEDTNKKVIWSASGSAASVTAEGKLEPLSVGTVMLKVTSYTNSNVSSEELPFEIEAIKDPLSSLTITRKKGLEKTTIALGSGFIDLNTVFDIKMIPADTSDKKVIWSGSGTAATIMSSGILTPVSVGEVMVQVTAVSDATISSQNRVFEVVEALEIPVIRITLTRKEGEEKTTTTVGTNIDLTNVFDVNISPEIASNKDVSWSISPSNDEVATISDSGVLTSKKAGKVTVKVTSVSNSRISSEVVEFVID